MIGKTLDGRYRIISLLGEGGMGKVYLAEHVVLEKRMAVKVLHEEYSRQEEVVKRFQQEAIAASRIGQENIVNVTDFGRTPEGALFFVMEELEGESLAALLRREGVLSPQRALPILAQVCRALSAAHSRGIVHRDLKPENVIILQREDRPDFVKVLDFGISKVGTAETNPQKLTRVGVIMGTPEYMAPEQAAGNNVDHRVDIYSLGVVTYELLTGTLPFTAENPLAVLMKHQSEAPVPPRQLRPDLDIPEDVEALILKAMAKSPDARQQFMSEIMVELSGCLVHLGMPPLTFSREGPSKPGLPAARSASGEFAKVSRSNGTLPLAGVATSEPDRKKPSGTLQLEGASGPASAIPLVRETPRAGQRSEDLSPEEIAAIGGGRRAKAIGWGATLFVLVAGGALWFTHPWRPAAGNLTVGPLPGALRAALPSPSVDVGQRPTSPPEKKEAPDAPQPPHATVPSVPTATIRRVTLHSEPEGATVFLGHSRLGVAPLDVELGDGETQLFRFSLAGYRGDTRRVASSDTEVRVTLSKASSKRHGGGVKSDAKSEEEDLKDDPFK